MEKKKRKIEIKTYRMGESLISALILLIFGIFLITNPVKLIKIAMYILGGVLALIGIFKILLYYKSNDGNKKDTLTGAVYIIIGFAAILCTAIFYDGVETVMRFLLAIYLLYVGVYRLVYAFKASGDKRLYFANAGIIILIAILLAVIPGLPLFVMGIFITIYALVEIAGFVIGRKDGVENVSEAVIVSEKIEKKDEEVKLLK